MEFEQMHNYQQTLLNNVFAQRLEQNEKQTKTWVDYKNRHKKVIEGLQVFPLSISENCMVPIGKRALMKGKLTHTNEILVCLGDGYFAKYSASQAIALCNRRIAWADEMLKSLEDEKNLYEMQQILPLEHDVFGEKNRKDIVEHWNEDKLDEWRAQHRQREKKYHQNLTKLKEEEKTDICTEEDLFKRLDELELQEEFEDEMCRLEAERKEFYSDDLKEGEVYDESEEDDISDSEEITMEMLEEELKKLKDIRSGVMTSSTANVSNFDIIEDEINTNPIENEQFNSIVNASQENLEATCSSEPVPENVNIKQKRRISFVEPCTVFDEHVTSQKDCFAMQDDIQSNENSEDDEDTIRIKFSHSSSIPNTSESSNLQIQSPTDIYKMFIVRKSILKRSPNDMVPNQIALTVNKDSCDNSENDDDDDLKPSAYKFVIKEEIQETKQTSLVNDGSIKKDKKKIVSRFKKERAMIRT